MMMSKKPLILLAMIALLSCGGGDDATPGGGGGGNDDELTSLPADTGGQHLAKTKGSTGADYGYYVYLPGSYDTHEKSYPLLVYLHGKGERGDGGTDQLKRVLGNGIAKLINNNQWKDKPDYPMIVVSPQYDNTDGVGNDNNWGEGHPEYLKKFIEHVKSTYRVNPKRIYLTGLSHGGTGVYDYLILQEDETSYIAAAAVVAAYGPNKNYAKPNNTPIWVFVGSGDTNNFNTSKAFVAKYNEQVPAPEYDALFTVYPGAGHDVWTRTYNLSGMAETTDASYDPYDKSVFEWMFQYKRED